MSRDGEKNIARVLTFPRFYMKGFFSILETCVWECLRTKHFLTLQVVECTPPPTRCSSRVRGVTNRWTRKHTGGGGGEIVPVKG